MKYAGLIGIYRDNYIHMYVEKYELWANYFYIFTICLKDFKIHPSHCAWTVCFAVFACNSWVARIEFAVEGVPAFPRDMQVLISPNMYSMESSAVLQGSIVVWCGQDLSLVPSCANIFKTLRDVTIGSHTCQHSVPRFSYASITRMHVM